MDAAMDSLSDDHALRVNLPDQTPRDARLVRFSLPQQLDRPVDDLPISARTRITQRLLRWLLECLLIGGIVVDALLELRLAAAELPEYQRSERGVAVLDCLRAYLAASDRQRRQDHGDRVHSQPPSRSPGHPGPSLRLTPGDQQGQHLPSISHDGCTRGGQECFALSWDRPRRGRPALRAPCTTPSRIIATHRKKPLTCSVFEPPIGIEPMTYALRGTRDLAAHALTAPMARAIARMAPAALGLSGNPVHKPVHEQEAVARPSERLNAPGPRG